MAPGKAFKPNGFVLFAQELQKQHGQKYPSLKDACDGAAPLWSRMSKEQRQPYDDRAKGMRGQSNPTRYTSEGYDVEALTREDRLKTKAEEITRQEIKNIITMAQKKSSLETETFFVIHFNIFCYYQRSDRYYPAEIAVLSFNLQDGVKPENVFHFLIKPGALPMGYKFDAKQHSDETHELPIPVNDDDEINTEEVYFELKAFFQKKMPQGSNKMPILYADAKCIKIVQGILDDWADTFEGASDLFRVFKLQTMFYFLRNICAGDQVWTSFTFSDRELEKDVYAYVTEIACPYHAGSPKPLYCSKSIVQRYAYIICDNCCSDLNIEYVPGQHVPIYSAVPELDSASNCSTNMSSALSISDFDNDFETESIISSWDSDSVTDNASTTSFDDEFPSLGQKYSRSVSGSGEPNFSGSTERSYSSVINKTIPDVFKKEMSNLSISSGSPVSKGRGFRRKFADSEVNSGTSTSEVSTLASGQRLKLLGKGRGFIPKITSKPGE